MLLRDGDTITVSFTGQYNREHNALKLGTDVALGMSLIANHGTVACYGSKGKTVLTRKDMFVPGAESTADELDKWRSILSIVGKRAFVDMLRDIAQTPCPRIRDLSQADRARLLQRLWDEYGLEIAA